MPQKRKFKLMTRRFFVRDSARALFYARPSIDYTYKRGTSEPLIMNLRAKRHGAISRVATIIVIAVLVVAAVAGTAAYYYLSQTHKSVSVTLADFLPQGRDAIFYAGIDQGYYAKQGIDLSITYGKGGAAALQLVATGSAQFAVTDPVAMVLAYAKGSQTQMIFQFEENPTAGLAYNANKVNISSVKDLQGQSLLISPADSEYSIIPALMADGGANWTSVKQVNVDTTAYVTAFLSGDATMVPAFYDSLWVTISQEAPSRGINAQFIGLNALGYNAMGEVIVTSPNLVSQNPGLVKGFVTATLESLQYAMSNPNQAISSLVKAESSVNSTIALQQLKNQFSLNPVSSNQLGLIDSTKVAGAITIATNAYNLTSPPSSSGVFTNTYAQDALASASTTT